MDATGAYSGWRGAHETLSDSFVQFREVGRLDGCGQVLRGLARCTEEPELVL